MTAFGSHLCRAILALLLVSCIASAQDAPLHEVIDQHLRPPFGLTSALCTDAEFVRRASLDLTGFPPSASEVREFLADNATDKRARLINRLLESPHADRHLATTLDLMLMERRANQHVTQDEWHAYLLKSVRERKPWNVLAREILSADGDDPATRPAARFILDRQSEANLLARDIGRIFFGRDLQCAQCHDHPNIDDYLQSDYQGLLAFVSPGYAVVRKVKVTEGDKEVTKDVTVQAEKAGSDLTFESVFIKGVRHRTGPRLLDNVSIEEPFALPGEDYEIAPADGVKSVPKFSRQRKLAELATDGSNRMFNENIANRLWAHMMGRGLVHPVDLHHYDNPPTHPALMTLLGERMAAMNFDLRAFLREIALSQAYQRSFDLPEQPLVAGGEAVAQITALESEQEPLAESAGAASRAFEEALSAWSDAEAGALPLADELEKTRTAYSEARNKNDAAQQELTKVQSELAEKQAALSAVQQAATSSQEAVVRLAGDQELAAAAQTFAARAKELSDVVTTLTNTVAEKTAAAASTSVSLAAARTAVDEAHAKFAPQAQIVREAEQRMLQVRRELQRVKTARSSWSNRLEAARTLGSLRQRQQAIAAAEEAEAARQAERATAEQILKESEGVLEKHRKMLTAAESSLAAATDILKAELAVREQKLVELNLIQAVVESANDASSKLPSDAVLADVTQRLKSHFESLQAQSGDNQSAIDNATAAVAQATAGRDAAQLAVDQANAVRTEHEQSLAEASATLAAVQEQLTKARAELDAAQSEIAALWTSDFTVASLKPLTPEQLCWTVFQVTGVYDRYWQTEEAELNKTAPLTPEQQQDAAQVLARNQEIEQRTFDKLKGNVATFIQFYGAAAGQPQGDFFATADQALFAANGSSLNSWLAPAGDNVTQKMIQASDPAQAAEELYLAVLNRLPTAEEADEVASHLKDRTDDRPVAVQELVWGLINSIEFRFNH